MRKEYSDMKTNILKQLKQYGNVQGLMKYINVDTLYIQHEKQSNKKATGIDKITKDMYQRRVVSNLTNLIEKMKNHKYKPQATRRVEIPKPNGKTRPLGILSYEDKLIQSQMADIMNIILEPYFKDFSYGFRPERDCHQAVKRLDEIIMHGKVKWIVEADIKGYFDHIDHEILIRMLEVLIKDKDFIGLIKRYLKAGYMSKGEIYETEEGTPQGGNISPILANLYLHVVLDRWFDDDFRKLCKGEIYIVRYADDFVCMFQYESDAKLFYEMLINRFAQFKLEIETSKTKIMPFGRYTEENNSFDFLGFTISNGKTRKGYYMVNYTTSKKKSKIKHKEISDYIKAKRTTKPKDLIKEINSKLRGIFNYYGISGNYKWMINFRNYVMKILKKWLSRRSQKGKISWKKLRRIIEYNPLVKPEISFNIW